jgi:hypothetical protein
MRKICRLLVCSCLFAGMFAVSANAQYRKYPVGTPAIGESYHVEVSGDLWKPSPTLMVSSEQFGLIGTEIDAVNDLGFQAARFREFRVVLRPAKKHKFRLDYIPISFNGDTTLRRDITYNGLLYRANLPVQSSLEWKAYHFGYEYDFLYRDRWFVGLLLQAKYTDVNVAINSPAIEPQHNQVAAPIPALGGIVRVYPMSNVSITGELTGFKLPTSVDKQGRYDGKFLDFNLYGTVNFSNNFGAQVGYRSIDVMYKVEQDTGDFTLKGLYFGGVARF